LKKLGYSAAQVQAIVDSVRGTATLKGVAEFSPAELESRGLLPAEIARWRSRWSRYSICARHSRRT